jgi:hypothetical protein
VAGQRYTVRTMTRAEVDLAVDWAAAEGWNPGLHDADCFHATDPGGFLVGLLDDQPVATISVVEYGDAFGFLGLYIVKEGFRGRGYGYALWNVGLARLDDRVIGLDGVVAQQANYEKFGFRAAYRNVRYEGARGSLANADPAIVPLSTRRFHEVAVYDRPFFPGDRTRFLLCWIRPPEGHALGYVRDGSLAGYGVVRACRTGFKLGPLFADDERIAEALFLALQEKIPAGAAIFLDTPAVNAAATGLAERHGMKPVFETARMYTGRAPNLPVQRIFGVTSFELG